MSCHDEPKSKPRHSNVRVENGVWRCQPGMYMRTCVIHLYREHIEPECEMYGKTIPSKRLWQTRCGAFQAVEDVQMRDSMSELNFCQWCKALLAKGKAVVVYEHAVHAAERKEVASRTFDPVRSAEPEHRKAPPLVLTPPKGQLW